VKFELTAVREFSSEVFDFRDVLASKKLIDKSFKRCVTGSFLDLILCFRLLAFQLWAFH